MSEEQLLAIFLGPIIWAMGSMAVIFGPWYAKILGSFIVVPLLVVFVIALRNEIRRTR